MSIAVISSWAKRTVAPWWTAAVLTPPVAAVSTAMTGSSTWEKASIRPMVSRPSPIMAAMSVMVRAVMDSAPATSTACRPSLSREGWTLSARAHSTTTASSFSAVAAPVRSSSPS